MIISRTPFRISFFGGGTDYPAWWRENRGAVLATTIDKYCYITCRYLPQFFEYKHRIVYSKMEVVKDTSAIEHPSIRACLQYMDIKEGLEIHHDGDLPARAGLGSSSSFTVGLLHTLHALKGLMPCKKELALRALHIEQDILKENVGTQDQVLAAFGGLNLVEFGGPDHFSIRPVTISSRRIASFQSHLMLFFTGLSRIASEIAHEQIQNIPRKKKELSAMLQLLDQGMEILNSNADLSEFGKLLHENWQLKRTLSGRISTPMIDEAYSAAVKAGALGGKILGAGGGGFMLIFAKPETQPRIKAKLKRLASVPFQFENLGSQIIFYHP